MFILVLVCSITSIIMIIVSIFMSGDSNQFSGALVGSSDLDLFKVSKERVGKKILKWSMYSLSFVLIICAVLARSLM